MRPEDSPKPERNGEKSGPVYDSEVTPVPARGTTPRTDAATAGVDFFVTDSDQRAYSATDYECLRDEMKKIECELSSAQEQIAALRADSERWTLLCNLWAASTELDLRQREDGRWEIVQGEPSENEVFQPLVGDIPDDVMDRAIAATRKEPEHG